MGYQTSVFQKIEPISNYPTESLKFEFVLFWIGRKKSQLSKAYKLSSIQFS
jgi:hypothetical protein